LAQRVSESPLRHGGGDSPQKIPPPDRQRQLDPSGVGGGANTAHQPPIDQTAYDHGYRALIGTALVGKVFDSHRSFGAPERCQHEELRASQFIVLSGPMRASQRMDDATEAIHELPARFLFLQDHRPTFAFPARQERDISIDIK